MADMNSVVGKVFAYILDNDGKTPTEIAKTMKVNVNTVSACCSELFRSKFVTRVPAVQSNGRTSFAYTAVKSMTDAEKAHTLTDRSSPASTRKRRSPRGGNSKTTLTALVTLQVGKSEALTMGMEDFVALYRDMQQMAKAFGIDRP